MDFNGQRTKEFMVNWLKKRVTDPVTELSKEEYEKLQDDDNDKVCVVFEGDIESESGKLFKNQAVKDDYNSISILIQLISMSKKLIMKDR